MTDDLQHAAEAMARLEPATADRHGVTIVPVALLDGAIAVARAFLPFLDDSPPTAEWLEGLGFGGGPGPGPMRYFRHPYDSCWIVTLDGLSFRPVHETRGRFLHWLASVGRCPEAKP